MDYLSILEVSATGMDFQRARMEALANNIANAQSTRGANGAVYTPLEAVATASLPQSGFAGLVDMQAQLQGVEQVELVPKNVAPKLVYKPEHPDADEQGYVHMPDVNPVDEMMNLMTATRGFEANVKVFNAAKSMALKALEIGE